MIWIKIIPSKKVTTDDVYEEIRVIVLMQKQPYQ